MKRHKVPKPDITPPEYYTWKDLNLRMNLDLYGRVFRIVDADDFTRKFFSNEGYALHAAEGFPDDPFIHTRAMINMK